MYVVGNTNITFSKKKKNLLFCISGRCVHVSCYDKYNKSPEVLYLVKFRKKNSGIHLSGADPML